MKRRSTNNKIFLLAILAILLGTLMILNVLLIELNNYHLYSNKDLSSYKNTSIKTSTIFAKRGNIFDRNNQVIAQDRVTYNILFYLSTTRKGANNKPAYVVDKDLTAEKVSSILGCSKEHVLNYLNKNLYQTEIGDVGRGLSLSQKTAIESLGLPGISFVSVISRYYPNSNFASYLVGFAHNTRQSDDSYTMTGMMGLESKFNDLLQGINGSQTYRTDVYGYQLPNETISYTASKDGNDLYLTLDSYIQTNLNEALDNIYKCDKTNENAFGVVMEAKTGKILGWGNSPSINQNYPKIENWLDYNCMVSIEPGSIMKPFTFAATMDANSSFSLEDTFNSKPLYYKYDATKDQIYRVNDKTAGSTYLQNISGRNEFGTVTYRVGFEQSLNVGTAMMLANYITTKQLRDYFEAFGFFKKIGIYGVEEASGVENLTNPVDVVNSSYGQASSYTVMQILQAYSAFCNEGTMVKPYVIDKIVDSYTNEIIYQGKREESGTPIKKETATRILDLMYDTYNVHTNYWNKLFMIDDVKVGGKTGTGEVSENGGYNGAYLHSFVSIFPIDNPQYICLFAYKNKSMGTSNDFPTNVRKLMQSITNKYLISEEIIEKENKKEINTMPNLVNHSVDYVNAKCEALKVNQIKIGIGNTVIDQYPKVNDKIITGQKVFVLYGKEGISMPDMTNWTNNDILKFWDLAKIAIEIQGSGYVYYQNILPNTIISNDDEIIVKLR